MAVKRTNNEHPLAVTLAMPNSSLLMNVYLAWQTANGRCSVISSHQVILLPFQRVLIDLCRRLLIFVLIISQDCGRGVRVEGQFQAAQQTRAQDEKSGFGNPCLVIGGGQVQDGFLPALDRGPQGHRAGTEAKWVMSRATRDEFAGSKKQLSRGG